jgi:chromatin assembly factor 1 subunit B
LISGCIDNTARLWDANEAKCLNVITDHHHFVQGVCWDPLNQYFITQSSDRSVNVYSLQKPSNESVNVNMIKNFKMFKLYQKSSRIEIPNEISTNEGETSNSTPSSSKRFYKMYQDENLTTFFRRCSFTPDGNLLLTPTGLLKDTNLESNSSNNSNNSNNNYCVFVYARNQLNSKPLLALPGHKRPTIAIKCNPNRYKLIEDDITPWLQVSYRMIFAVITQDSVIIYDTQHLQPIAMLGNLHYSTLTDLSWTFDGNSIIFTSTDGFCSMATFDNGELGEIIEHVDMDINVTNIDTSPLKPQMQTDDLIPIPISSPIPMIIESNTDR